MPASTVSFQFGYTCFCGPTFGTYGLAEDPSQCNMQCVGQPEYACGSGYRNSVYEIQLLKFTGMLIIGNWDRKKVL